MSRTPQIRILLLALLCAGLLGAGAAGEGAQGGKSRPAGKPAPRETDSKQKPAALFPRTGILRIQSPGANAVQAALPPAIRLAPASPETVFWGADDSTRAMLALVTDPAGNAPRDPSGTPISIPLLFRIVSSPQGASGVRLTDGVREDPAALQVPTDPTGHAAVFLQGRGGAGLYTVDVTAPGEFDRFLPASTPGLTFYTFTAGVPVNFQNFTVEQNRQADGRDSALVQVTAVDSNGQPVDGAPLLAILRDVDDGLALPLASMGSGLYRGRVASHHAGDLFVEVLDERTGFGVPTGVTFVPGPASQVFLHTLGDLVPGPGERSIDLEGLVLDANGNALTEPGRRVEFTTSLGTITPLLKVPAIPGAHQVRLTHDGLGVAEVAFRDVLSGLEGRVQVVFPAVSLGRGIPPVLHVEPPRPPTRFTLPLRVYVEPGWVLDWARITVRYPPALARFVTATDASPQDAYVTQVMQSQPGELTVLAAAFDGPPAGGPVDLLSCEFDCEEEGLTDFTFGDVILEGHPQTGLPPGAAAIALPNLPAEPVSVFQKEPTKTICVNVIWSTGCGDEAKMKQWVDDAIKALQEGLNKGCCTILIEKKGPCRMDLGAAGESDFRPDPAGGRQTRLSRSNEDIIRRTQSGGNAPCKRDDDCVNIYVVKAINWRNPLGGRGGGENGEADVPNNFDDNCNKKKGSIRDRDGRPIRGADGRELPAKSLSSAFVICRPDKQDFIHTFVHEFGHMMGLNHHNETSSTADDGAENAMREKNGKGTCFVDFQCQWIMTDANGFCRDLKK